MQAYLILTDNKTTELFYGGGAGGGKSWLGCFWIIDQCLKYPGIRAVIGRAHLKTLRESTLLTFFEILKENGFKRDVDYKYNYIESKVTFLNGSEVFCKDLFLYPSDPEFDSLGSTEYTIAFLDEVSEITEKAKNIVMSRIRFKLKEYSLIPKLLMASNPAKNFAFRDYWKPWSEGTLPDFRAFIPALVGDNPHISEFYEENLKKLDKNSRERLLHGNWNYDDDPAKLFEYDDIQDMFTNPPSTDATSYLSVDVARFGADKTVIIHWKGLYIFKIYERVKSSLRSTREFIEHLCYEERIAHSRIIIDEDGVGGGLVDEMKTVKGFVNNSRPIENDSSKKKHNFSNLKTQCYFKLAELVHDHKIGIYPDVSVEVKDLISEDLGQMKVRDWAKENKVALIGKDLIKENLGRSPDHGDAIMMRMYFEFKGGTFGYMSTK